MNIRRMAQGDRKHHKRSKRLNKVGRYKYLRMFYNEIIFYLFKNTKFFTASQSRMANKITSPSMNSNKMAQQNNLRTVRIRIIYHLANLNENIITVIRITVDY